MKKGTNSQGYIAIGVIVIIISLAVFALVNQSKDMIDWIGLIFILIAELLLIGGIVMVNQRGKQDKVFFSAGILSVLSIYLVLDFIVSMIFCLALRTQAKILTAVQLVMLALTAIICILINGFSGKANENN
jgi:hypothetical protein